MVYYLSMGDIKKIGDEYVIEFFARGLNYRQKAGKDRAQAESLLKDIEGKIARGEAAMMVRDVDYDIFFHDFLSEASRVHPSQSVVRFKQLVGGFQDYLKSECSELKKLSEITPRVIELYKHFLVKQKPSATRSVNPHAINFSLILLKIVLEYAIKWGYLNDNPTTHISLLDRSKFVQKRPVVSLRRPHELPTSRLRFALTLVEKNVPLTRMGELLGYRDILRTFCLWSALKEYLRQPLLNGKSP